MHAGSPASSRHFWLRSVALIVGAAGLFFLGRMSVGMSNARRLVAAGSSGSSTTSSSPSNAVDAPAGPEEWRRKVSLAPASPAGEQDRLRLLQAWARVAPAAALEYVRKSLPRDRQAEALTAIFAAWAKNNPTEAWDWVIAKENGEAGHLHTVLSEVAKNDLKLAEGFARTYATQHPDLASNAYFSVLDGALYSGGYEAAKTVVADAAVPNDEQRSLLVNYLAGDWARYQPEEAAQWVLRMPESTTRTQALNAVTQAWSDADPARAADFAVKLPAGAERQAALQQAISKWTLSDPLQAGEWVLKYNAHGDFDQAVASIATSSELMNHNVSLALDWAGTIQEQALRRRSTAAIVATWYSADPNSALKYVKTSPDLSSDLRDELLHNLPAHN